MPKTICIMCKQMYDTDEGTFEQKIIADESFCPVCWKNNIMAFTDGGIEFAYLDGFGENRGL